MTKPDKGNIIFLTMPPTRNRVRSFVFLQMLGIATLKYYHTFVNMTVIVQSALTLPQIKSTLFWDFRGQNLKIFTVIFLFIVKIVTHLNFQVLHSVD